MRIPPTRSAIDDREAMIRLIDIVGQEHIFAPYHLDTPLPAAPGLLALVRPTGYRFAGLHSIIHPPWWDVLYIEQASNVCRRAGRLLCELQARDLGPTQVMVRWMKEATEADRIAAEQALISAHEPQFNMRQSAPDIAPAIAV